MKKLYFVIVVIFFVLQITVVAQNDGGVSIGKGDSDADPSAILELVSTNKGLLIPRLSSSEREGISSPANGLIVYDTTYSSLYYWNGAIWKQVAGIKLSSGINYPAGAVENDLFYKTSDNLLYIYSSGSWLAVGSRKQVLELDSTTLKLLEEGKTTGSEVDLSVLFQDLSLSGTTLTISDGNSVNLGALNQTLSLNSTILTLTNGGSVDFTSLLTASNISISPVTGLSATNVQDAIAELKTGSGDMLKSVYDVNDNSIVDDADKVNGHTVQSDVPANASFTDNQDLYMSGNTIYLTGSTASVTLPGAVTGGDMTMSVYDTNSNSVVDQAETAQTVYDNAITSAKIANQSIQPVDMSGITTNGTSGQVLTSDGTGGFSWSSSAGGSGTVTAVSVTSANGFSGTSSGGTTPALTLGTSVTGLLKGNGTGMSAAVAGTDYQAPITNSLTLGSASNAVTLTAPTSNVGAYNLTLPTTAGTADYVLKTDGSGVLRWDVDATGAAGGGITSVGLSLPLYNSFTTLTADGSFTGTLSSQTANTVLAGPGSGSSAAPSFRSLVANDIPSLDWAKITTGKPTTLAGYGITDALSNPMSASGDIIYGGTSGAATRLAKGTDGQVLTLASGVPTWAAATGGISSVTGTANQITANTSSGAVTLSLPSTISGLTSVAATTFTGALSGNATTATNVAGGSAGQVLYQTAAGTTGKLSVGTNGQVLTLASGVPTWANAASGFTNPMTTTGDLIVGGASGAAGRLAAGTSGYVLTSNGAGTAPSWQVAASGGMSDPMTATGDIIYRDASGNPTALAAGTDGKVLTLASGLPTWASPTANTLNITEISGTSYVVDSNGYEDAVIICVSGTPAITLPTASASNKGRVLYLVDLGGGGASSITPVIVGTLTNLADDTSLAIVSTGSYWVCISGY